MSESQQLSFSIAQQENYAFLVRFDNDLPPLLADEPAPLGRGMGPDPARLLAAGFANCLSASLLFALRKLKNQPGRILTSATARMESNDKGRLRIGAGSVDIRIESPAGMLVHLDRVLAQFEDFCIVTQSVRSGFPVEVMVRDSTGTILK